ESSSLNTPSIWLVKWFSWVQNNEKQVAANRKKELQAVIDDAKAECEKVVEENTQLKQKIAILEQAGG
ncbi:hypothetical protein ABTJ09_21070, partial [Acinetobacter baumannii]